MNRNIAAGIIFSTILNLIIKSVWILGIDLSVQRLIGNTMYGTYYTLYSFSMLFLIALDMGITQYNTRHIAQNPHLLSKNLYNLAALKFVMGGVYLLILLVASIFFDLFSEWMHVLVLLGIANFFNSFTLYFRSNLSALFYLKTDALFSIADRFLLIVFCGVLLSGWTSYYISIEVFAWLQFASSGLTCLVAGIVNMRLAGMPRFHIDKKLSQAALMAGLPFAILHLVMSFYTRTDVVIMSLIIPDGKAQAGIYAASYRLFDAFSQFTIIASGIMYPYFSRSLQTGDAIEPLFGFIIRSLLGASFIVAVACLFFAPFIAAFLFKDDIVETSATLQVLIWISIPYVVSIIAGAYITARGQVRLLIVVGLIAWLINLFGNIWLIPQLGAKGAAITAILTHGFSAVVLMYFSFRYLQFQKTSRYIIRTLSLCLIWILIGWGCTEIPLPVRSQFLSFILVSILAFLVLILPDRQIFRKSLPLTENKTDLMI